MIATTFADQGGNENSEPIKRQRKWKAETLTVPELQGLSVSPLTTPKETLTMSTLRRSFSRSDSTASDSAPKERVGGLLYLMDGTFRKHMLFTLYLMPSLFFFSLLTVPPSQKPPTNSLRIDQFLRPFTLKAVEELLGKTGSVKSFWMDHIKTHCFVSVIILSL